MKDKFVILQKIRDAKKVMSGSMLKENRTWDVAALEKL